VSVAAVAAADKAERRAEAELERRRKAGLPVPDPTPPRHVADQVTPSAPSAPSAPSVPSAPSKTPVAEAGSSLGPTPRLPDVSGVDPAALHAALAMGPDVPDGKSSGVYGFAGAKASEAGASKAIALRLEPLKPGMPHFEKVLSESKQNVLIGSHRGVVDVLVSDECVSKKHATLALVGIHGELALSIMDTSTNGTFVNGERLQAKKKRYRIRNGDKLQIMDPTVDEEFGWKVDFGNTVAFFSRA
jgi:hypothetical protein